MSAGTAAAVIPVRVGSQRLPGKALLAESGQPLFLHTWERAIQAGCFSGVWIATDSDEVAAAAQTAGAAVARTSEHPRTGSERCAEALPQLGPVQFVVDIQGDWPEIEPRDLERLVEQLRAGPEPTATLAASLEDPDALADPNVVKVVRDRSGAAMYFSRAPIPHRKNGVATDYPTLRHIGVYGFSRNALAGIPTLPSSGLDEIEALEQLRFLENGLSMKVLLAEGQPWGIETRADYDAFLRRRQEQEQHP